MKLKAIPLSVALFSICTFLTIACSAEKDISLTSPPPAPAPTEIPQNPTSESNPNGPATPLASATPKPVAATEYRLLCDNRYALGVVAISSYASPLGFGATIKIGEEFAGQPLDMTNLEEHSRPVVLSLPASGKATALLASKRRPGKWGTEPTDFRVMLADIDLVKWSGVAHDLGQEIKPNNALQNFSDRERFAIRTYGASDDGTYALVARSKSYVLLATATRTVIGEVAVDSGDAVVNPTLRASDMVVGFSTLSKKGTGFRTAIVALTISKAGKLSSKAVVGVDDLRRPLQPVSPATGDVWMGVKVDGTVVAVDPVTAKVSTVDIDKIPTTPMMPAAAFWRDAAGGLNMVATFESVKAAVAPTTGFVVDAAFMRMMAIDIAKGTAKSSGGDVVYPLDVTMQVQKGIRSDYSPIARDIKASPDGKAVFVSFVSGLNNRLYRLQANGVTGLGLTGVSQEECGAFDLGVSP